MKNIKIISIVLLIFFAFMIYRGIKNNQIRKLTKSKTELETLYKVAQDQKQVYIDSNKVLKSDLTQLEAIKTTLADKLTKTLSETSYQIEAYKNRIRELNSLPADTVYQNLFSMYPTFNQVLKFRFAENQIREFNIDILERNHFENLYVKSTKSLVICTDLNKQNDLIIGNLSGQNTNLQKQVDLSELQLVNLQDNLKLSDKTLNKQKRRTFFYKVTTIAAGTGLLIFAIK
jgi:ribonuclease HII